MFRVLTVLALLSVSACGGTTTSMTEMGPPDIAAMPPRAETPADVTFAIILNDVRVTNGVNVVSFDPHLSLAAQAHADDMLARDYFAHESPEGSTVGDRATAAGYVWTTIGENIAQGYDTQDDVMAGWTGSAGHHANNIDPDFEDFGLGVAGSGSDKRWVLVLGAE